MRRPGAPSAFLAIIASGDITFTSAVTQAQGVYLADGVIMVETDGLGGTDSQFLGEGTFAAHEFDLRREISTGNLNPAEKFTFRPDFWINTPGELWSARFLWKELAP